VGGAEGRPVAACCGVQPVLSLRRRAVFYAFVVLPVLASLTALTYRVCRDSYNSFVNAQSTELRTSCMLALQDSIVALSNERDQSGLHVALGEVTSPLRPFLTRSQRDTDAATSRLSGCLQSMRTTFEANQADVNRALSTVADAMTVVVDCRAGLNRTFPSPHASFYLRVDRAVRMVADLEVQLLRAGYSSPRTAGSPRITTQFAGMSMLTSLRLTYGALRGVAAMAIAGGRFEADVMARDFITAASVSRDYETRWGNILAGSVNVIETVGQLTAVTLFQVDMLRTELESYALSHSGGMLSGAVNTTTRYLDSSFTLYGPLFGGRPPATLAWLVLNISLTAHSAVLDPIQRMLLDSVESDVQRLRRDAVVAVVYAACTVLGTLIVTTIVGYLLERGRHIEALALAERLFAESSDALAGMVAHEVRNPLW